MIPEKGIKLNREEILFASPELISLPECDTFHHPGAKSAVRVVRPLCYLRSRRVVPRFASLGNLRDKGNLLLFGQSKMFLSSWFSSSVSCQVTRDGQDDLFQELAHES